MKNLAYQLICLSLIIGLNISCSNRSTDNQDANSMMDNDSNVEEFPGNDTILNYRDGTNISERSGNMDTIQLPKPILEAIEKDSTLRTAMIVEKILKVEQGETFYEVAFYPVNGKEVEVIFDSDGNRKPK